MKSRVLLIATALILTPTTGSAAEGYLSPVVVDNQSFPVARSSWYSVINFSNDWHAPRMRFVGGRWLQVGVHEGTDVFAEPGTPVLAVVPGRVEQVGWTFYSGWRVGIRDAEGRYWFYAHLSAFAPGLSIGDRIDSGRAVGRVGNTGYGNSPGHTNEFTYHLHLGIQRADGVWVNPYGTLRRLYRASTKS